MATGIVYFSLTFTALITVYFIGKGNGEKDGYQRGLQIGYKNGKEDYKKFVKDWIGETCRGKEEAE